MHQTPHYPLDPKTTVFLVVDPQLAFGQVVPVPEAEPALTNMRKTMQAWLEYSGRVFVTKHVYQNKDEVSSVSDFIPPIFNLLKSGSPHAKLYPGFNLPQVEILRKTEFNAMTCARRTWLSLQHSGFTTVVLCGFTTPICVEGTARGAVENGFKVVVIKDACASQAMGSETAEEAHESAIGRLGYVFAEILTTEEFIEQTQ